ncbi:MAG: ATP-binding protein [Candidatus Saccharicenans sp.]|jgi:PAS domain S-box-containing protein|nr:ATP-binding protein [Candidatus Saccharicenans sp.]MDH7492632.1 ATP-binding protein [Candidatus Saccharicenans sp.]
MRKSFFYLFLLLVLVLIVLGFINISRKLSWKEPYDGVTWIEGPAGLTAVKVDQDSPAYLSGLKPGDILFSINDTPVKNRIEYSKMLWLIDRLEQKALYQVGRSGTILSPSFYLTKKGVSATYIYLMLLGLATLAISLLVFFNTRRQFTGPYAFFYLVSFSLYSFYVFSATGQMDFLDNLFYWLDKVALLAFPPLLLNFFFIFPQKKKIIENKNRVAWFYLPGLALLLANVFLNAYLESALSEAQVLVFQKTLEKLELAHLAIYTTLALVLIIRDLVRAAYPYIKNQLRWIAVGLGLGSLPFSLFYVLPFLRDRLPTTPGQLSVLLQGLIPITLAYSISRYRLIQFEVLFKKGTTLIISFSLLAMVYFLVSSQTQLFSENRLNFILLGLLAIILGATLFTPLSELVQTVVDRVIYRRSYEYRRTLLTISSLLNRERNLNRLSDFLVETISKALSLKQTALFLAREGTNNEFYLLKSSQPDPELHSLLLSQAEIDQLQKAEFISFVQPEERPSSQKFFGLLLHRGLVNLLPLRLENKVMGFLAMSHKQDESYFSGEDRELLRTISTPVALALENAYLYNQEIIRSQELQRLKDYSDNIIESLTVGVAVIDQAGQVIGWNRVLEKQFGLGREQALNRHLAEVIGPENFQALFPPATQSEYQLLSEIGLTTGRGEKKIFDVARTPLFDNQMQAYGTIIVFEDVTEKIHLQQQLLTSEKLASIGLLSAGVAHEINTPLTGISSYVQMLQKKLTDAHYLQILQKIEAQTERVNRIIKNLLNFARNPADEYYHRVDLKESLEEIILLIDYRLKSLNIQLELALKPVVIYAQRERLQQVFINIILNAMDAMPGGGRLIIESNQRGDLALVKITDNGTGIKPEHLPRIFDPFFTTKGLGKGTGLGLSISFAIVKEHEGQILVDSTVGQGTTFTILLPTSLSEKNRLKIQPRGHQHEQ